MGRRRATTDALFALPSGRKGRVEVAVDRAVLAALREKTLTDADAGAVALARAVARGVDGAEAARNPWALAAVGRELREQLIRLRLDPVARGPGRESVAEFLAALARPTPGDGGGSAVGHPENA